MAEGPYYSQLPTVAVKPFGSRRHCFCQCLIVTHVCILAKDISIVFFKIQLPRSLYVPLSNDQAGSGFELSSVRYPALRKRSAICQSLSQLWSTKLLPGIFRGGFISLCVLALRICKWVVTLSLMDVLLQSLPLLRLYESYSFSLFVIWAP
jgi:hypothetical protein